MWALIPTPRSSTEWQPDFGPIPYPSFLLHEMGIVIAAPWCRGDLLRKIYALVSLKKPSNNHPNQVLIMESLCLGRG